MFIQLKLLIPLFSMIFFGCMPPKRDALYIKGLELKQYETSVGKLISIRNASDSDERNCLLIQIDQESKLMKSINISSVGNPLVVVDLDKQIKPKSISVQVNKEGAIRHVVDFGELGSYDMIIDGEGGIHSVSVDEKWHRAESKPQGVEAFIDGAWKRVYKTEKGFSVSKP